MFEKQKDSAAFKVDFSAGQVTSLIVGGKEMIYAPGPLFRIGLRTEAGDGKILTAYDAAEKTEGASCGHYAGFDEAIEVDVSVSGCELADWRIKVTNQSDLLIEWVEYPCVTVKPLRANGGEAEIMYPYNEGVLIDDIALHTYREPGYPSYASFDMFPNMVCSQFMCYMANGSGLYFAVHDPDRVVKQISFYEDRGGVALQIRQYCGCEFGESYESDHATIWEAFEGDWHDGAAIYRDWFCGHLPKDLKKTAESDMPEWYKDSPLVVSYPVRGVHDTDIMNPNELFPYCNALPMLDDIAKRSKSRLLVLMMHWEGSAPWAPPYVWPPYGGEEIFNTFADELHNRGNMLGVYCSGFGYTMKSNLVDDYTGYEEFEREHLRDVMCTGPKNELTSTVCTAQRFGYDICVKAPGAKQLLDRAYGPLLRSKIDYAQILDQNHGGGQYFCYSRTHGHAPAPGRWMTESMSELLSGWNEQGKGKLFGCESAAGEAYQAYLRFSDNRFELNWLYGRPVPLYAFLYHEYLRNFMGNQVCCGLSNEEDSLRYRMAYSFAAGDCMTIVLAPNGRLFASWGDHDFTKPAPDFDKTMDFAANMRDVYDEVGDFLTDGRMLKPEPVECAKLTYHISWSERTVDVPAVVTAAWEKNGRRIQLLVNHTDEAQVAVMGGKRYEIQPRKAVVAELA